MIFLPLSLPSLLGCFTVYVIASVYEQNGCKNANPLTCHKISCITSFVNPSTEASAFNLERVKILGKLSPLLTRLKRLQSILIPAFQAYLHLIMATRL